MLETFRRAKMGNLFFAIFILCGVPFSLHTQSYSFTAPVNGYQEVPFADPNNPNSGPFAGGSILDSVGMSSSAPLLELSSTTRLPEP